ncbi:MAG TPA: response regulator [Puia sp.]|jgi:two-component system alkaline phosphatase synthesis response regulator PhoP|nr:response regulator [Puia sp.]
MQKNNPRILVVEDNPDILELYTIMLGHNNYQILGKNRAEEIEPVIRNFSPDVIVLDMLLAGVDGLDVCKQIKDDPSTRHIPVIMVSAHASGLERSAEAGAEFFIAKPFEMATFLNTISRAINLKDQNT